jgi:hypothetical protein
MLGALKKVLSSTKVVMRKSTCSLQKIAPELKNYAT